MDRTVGPYQLGETLGALPFGELVAATHAARSEPLAVLLLDERLAKDVRLRGLLRLEMARAAGLRHPALARTVETGELAGALYLVVERPIGGRTLAQTLSDGTALPTDRVVSLVRQLADGLDAAHARRLLHGAIDPSCVLVGEGGSVKLVGLGVLPAAEEAGLVDIVVERHGPAFVAPEQTTGPRAVASADDYALGVIAATLLRQRAGGSALPPAVSAILDRQSARASTARFPSCVDFATALAEALSPDSTTDAPPATAVPPPTNVSPPPHASAGPLPPPVPTPPRFEPRAPSRHPVQSAAPDVSSAPLSETELITPPPDVTPVSTPTVTPPIAPAPPARSPVAGPSAPERPSQPADFGGWVRDIIDLPKATTPAAPVEPAATAPARQNPLPRRPRRPSTATPPTAASQPARAAPSKGTAVSSRTMDLTPAMLDFVKRQERPDPIGDAIRWAASRELSLQALVDRYAPDGKVAAVPLGIAVAGAVALLLLIAMQFVLATGVILLVIVLYVMRPLAQKLSGEGQAQLQAVRVRGPAELYLRAQVGSLKMYEIRLADSVVPSVGQGNLAALTEIAEPVPSPWRPASPDGTTLMTVQYALADVTATYLSMSRILLDLRDADGRVLFRQPRYAGEPGDELIASTQPFAVKRVRETIRSNIGRAQSLTAPIPDEIHAVFQAELGAQTSRLGLLIVGSLIGTIVLWNIAQSTRIGGMAIIVPLLCVAAWQGVALNRARRRAAHAAGDVSVVQLIGPVRLSERGEGRYRTYHMTLEDSSIFEISSEASRALEEQSPRQTDRNDAVQTIPGITVTYLPEAPILVQINDANGRELYRDPLLKDTTIKLPAMEG